MPEQVFSGSDKGGLINMKRKVLAVLFATALTAGMLSGCGKHRQYF